MKCEFSALRSYKWRKNLKSYYELVEGVESSNIKVFEEVVERNRDIYIKDNLYIIIQRLYQNVIQEGLRKISLVYSRISLGDISALIGMDPNDVHFLLMKNIKNGNISGYIEEDVYMSENTRRNSVDIGAKIRETIYLFQSVSKMMKCPKSKPISLDNIKKDGNFYDFTS
jgi:26S proteasome regulatory subunit N3